MNCLLVYHSKYGQTARVARRIAEVLRDRDIDTELQDIGQALQHDIPNAYEMVVIGAPIYTGSHSKQLLRFVQKNRSILNRKLTAFFSVSLSAAGDSNQQGDAQRCVDEFLRQADWKPSLTRLFAGSLPYRKYSMV